MLAIEDIDTSRLIGLLALGDPSVDLMLALDHIPDWDSKVVGKFLGMFAGGTTANVACAASMLGLSSAAFGRVGDDENGKFLISEFLKFGVKTNHIQIVSASRSAQAIISVSPVGEKALAYLPMMSTGIDDYKFSVQSILQTSSVIYSMPYDLIEFQRVSRLAHEVGTQVAIDIEAAVAPNTERMTALLKEADIVFFNAKGFEAAVGHKPTTHLASDLLNLGPHTIIVTCGAEGAIGVSRSGMVEHPAFPATVVDTTGAGDCFNAAVLVALLEQQTLYTALRFASAAASFSVAAIGARVGLPNRAMVDALIDARRQSFDITKL